MVRSDAVALVERQHGLVSRAQLRRLGLSYREVDQFWRSPDWEAVTDEVVRRTGAPRSTQQATMAAVLDAGPDAVLSHLSAANRWGRSACRLRPFTVVRTSNSRRVSTLATVHRVRALPGQWLTRLDGVPIVRPELLALQLFAVCSEARAERLTDRLWSDRLLSGASVGRFLDDLGERGRNGTAGLRRYLDARGSRYVPPASGLESRVKELLESVGLTLDRQVDSGGAANWSGRVDFRHPVLPFVLEVQSEKFHTALCDAAADDRRRRQLEEDGFTVLEVTDHLVWSDPAEFLRQVRAALTTAARRSARSGSIRC
jgi:very-short-patch-repair endonuclease